MQRDKGKGRAVDPPRRDSLPTPVSDESETARGQKRKRTEQATQSGAGQDEDDEKFTKYFDPNQDPEIRRQVKRKSRALEREFNGEYSKDLVSGHEANACAAVMNYTEMEAKVREATNNEPW